MHCCLLTSFVWVVLLEEKFCSDGVELTAPGGLWSQNWDAWAAKLGISLASLLSRTNCPLHGSTQFPSEGRRGQIAKAPQAPGPEHALWALPAGS